MALEEVGNEWAQEMLLTRWQSRSERWFGAPIAKAFTRLTHRGTTASAISERLVAWFCSDDIPYQTASDLAEVIAALNTPVVAEQLGARLRRGWHERDQSQASAHVDALESLMHEHASDVIVLGVADEALPLTVRRRFAQALAASRAPIEIERLRSLATGGDAFVRACVIDRLASFGWTSVEREMKLALRDCQRAASTTPDVDLLQSRCVGVLASHDRLSLLAQSELRQDVWFRVGLFRLLEVLIARPSSDLVPMLIGFLDVPSTRIRAHLAVALLSVGEVVRAKELRDTLLIGPREDFTETDLLDGLQFVATDEALEWGKSTWNASQDARAANPGFMLHKYLDALERIGSPGARAEMVRIIESVEGDYDVASALSYLRHLATADLQDWLVNLAYKHETDRAVQSWCLELIGLGGDLSSEGFLTQRLTHQDSLVRSGAFRALMRVHQRQGRLWYGVAQPGNGNDPIPVVSDLSGN